MARKKKQNKTAAAGEKVYFLKNPDGFLFTHLFASTAIRDRLTELTGKESEIIPVSLKIAPLDLIKSFGKNIVVEINFPESFPGAAYTVASSKPVKILAKRCGTEYSAFMQQLFEPVGENLSGLLQEQIRGISVDCRLTDLAHYPAHEDGALPWIRYHVDIPDREPLFLHQAVSKQLILSLCGHFMQEEVTPEAFSSAERLLGVLRDLNRKFQEFLLRGIETSGTGVVSLAGGPEDNTEPESLNLEELRLAPDRTIRAILEEVSRRRMHVRTFVYALSGMSSELRSRFLQNMSRNRKKEVREGLSLWEGTADEVMQAQRDLAWVIVDMVEKGEFKLSKVLQSKLEKLLAAMNEKMAKSAKEYIESGTFGSSMQALNTVLLQLLMRRVKRRVLIQALTFVQEETLRRFYDNSTKFARKLLKEDIDHWKRSAPEEFERLTTGAAAQRAVIRQAVHLKREFNRFPF